MENKTTTELLELLSKLTDEKGDFKAGGKYDRIMEELKTRYPFYDIFNEEYENSLPALREEIDELKADIKKLKRHKHDGKSGDVLIRI